MPHSGLVAPTPRPTHTLRPRYLRHVPPRRCLAEAIRTRLCRRGPRVPSVDTTARMAAIAGGRRAPCHGCGHRAVRRLSSRPCLAQRRRHSAQPRAQPLRARRPRPCRQHGGARRHHDPTRPGADRAARGHQLPAFRPASRAVGVSARDHRPGVRDVTDLLHALRRIPRSRSRSLGQPRPRHTKRRSDRHSIRHHVHNRHRRQLSDLGAKRTCAPPLPPFPTAVTSTPTRSACP